MQQALSFIHEAREEWSKVVWPTRKAATQLTIAVVAVSIAIGALVGGLDFIFTNVMNTLLAK